MTDNALLSLIEGIWTRFHASRYGNWNLLDLSARNCFIVVGTEVEAEYGPISVEQWNRVATLAKDGEIFTFTDVDYPPTVIPWWTAAEREAAAKRRARAKERAALVAAIETAKLSVIGAEVRLAEHDAETAKLASS
jgi:hypothetical protein